MEVPLLHPVPPTPKVMGQLTAGISIKKDQAEIGQTPGLRPAPLPPHEGLQALLLTGAPDLGPAWERTVPQTPRPCANPGGGRLWEGGRHRALSEPFLTALGAQPGHIKTGCWAFLFPRI